MSSAETDDQVPAHDGLFYSSDEQLLRFAVPFLREGIAHDEAVVIVANDDTRELLEPALEGLGPVVFVSPHEVFRRTATAVGAYRDLVEDAMAHGAQRVRAISEVNFGTTTHAQVESIRFEAVANLALAAHPLWNVCLYDTRRIRAERLTASAHAHPYVVSDGHRRPNPDYVPPVELLRRHSQIRPYTIEARPPDLEFRDLHAVGLSAVRSAIDALASAASVLPRDQIDDFLAAISEIASNALVHGAGPVSVRAWVTHQRHVATITDHGSGFDDPLAGFLPAPVKGLPVHGAGLWLARNFSDSLDFSTTTDGFTARIACWTN